MSLSVLAGGMTIPLTLQGVPLGGLRLGAPLGSGSGGVAWAATTSEGEQVAVRVLPDVEPARARARQRRLDALRAVTHPGLARVLQMPDESDERLLVTEMIVGPTLATVRTGRLGVTGPEAVTLVRDLADAVAAMHDAGGVHGDISPSNVLMRAQPDDVARPVLIDVAGDLGAEAGTPGFIAPEVRAGRAAGTAADVWAIATLGVWAAQVVDRDALTAMMRPALSDDPARRPTAAELAASRGARPDTPVRVPPPSVLAGATLREQAQRQATVVRPVRRRRPRHRRRSAGRAAAVACLALLALGGGILGGWRWLDAQGGAAAGPVPSRTTDDELIDRVIDLVDRRDEAIVAGDAEALGALTVPGSPAQQDDLALLDDLESDGATVSGLSTAVTEPVVVEPAALEDGTRTATVQATLTQSGYERTRGSTTVHVEAAAPRCVRLELRLDEGQWLVETAARCSG